LNAVSYAHLIPVVAGGIAAGDKPDGTPLHVDWRIHTVGPENACLVCQDALRRSDVALDIDGRLDDPDYATAAGVRERSASATTRTKDDVLRLCAGARAHHGPLRQPTLSMAAWCGGYPG